MTPLTPNSSIAMLAPRRRLIRRTAAVAAGLLVLGGAPLVAAAAGADNSPSESTDAPAKTESSLDVSELGRDVAFELVGPLGLATDIPMPASQPDDPEPVDAGDVDAGGTVQPRATAAGPQTVVDATAGAQVQESDAADREALAFVVAVLADTYEWGERSARVELLQETLGVAVDGQYGTATLNAHRESLDAAQMSVENVPVVPELALTAGPSPSAWAALRDCESGGDYTITNPSGKYRGAYQFNQSTWNSVAERHAPDLVGVDPAAAAPADQDAMAMALYSERGAQPWPSCGRHL